MKGGTSGRTLPKILSILRISQCLLKMDSIFLYCSWKLLIKPHSCFSSWYLSLGSKHDSCGAIPFLQTDSLSVVLERHNQHPKSSSGESAWTDPLECSVTTVVTTMHRDIAVPISCFKESLGKQKIFTFHNSNVQIIDLLTIPAKFQSDIVSVGIQPIWELNQWRFLPDKEQIIYVLLVKDEFLPLIPKKSTCPPIHSWTHWNWFSCI